MRIISNANAGGIGAPTPLDNYLSPVQEPRGESTSAYGAGDGENTLKPPNPEEVFSFVRHGKIKKLREVLQAIPQRRFDPALVEASFVLCAHQW